MSRRMQRMKRRDYQKWYRLTSMKLRFTLFDTLQAGLPPLEVHRITQAALRDWYLVYPQEEQHDA